MQAPKMRCFHCGKPGHRKSNYFARTSTQAPVYKCFKCGNNGNMVRDCSERQVQVAMTTVHSNGRCNAWLKRFFRRPSYATASSETFSKSSPPEGPHWRWSNVDSIGHQHRSHVTFLYRQNVKKIRRIREKVQSLESILSFYRGFLSDYPSIANPLTDLNKKGRPDKIELGEAQESLSLGEGTDEMTSEWISHVKPRPCVTYFVYSVCVFLNVYKDVLILFIGLNISYITKAAMSRY